MAPIDNVYDDDDIEDVEGEQAEEEEVEEESGDETFIEKVTEEAIAEHETVLADYDEDPQTPKELAENESIKKFLVRKVRNKLLESFEEHRMWAQDVELMAMVKKWKRMMAMDDQLDSITAMERILRQTAVIAEVVEQQVDEFMETEVAEAEDDDTN